MAKSSPVLVYVCECYAPLTQQLTLLFALCLYYYSFQTSARFSVLHLAHFEHSCAMVVESYDTRNTHDT